VNADQRSQLRLSFAWLDWRAKTEVGFMSQEYLFLESNQARAVSVAVNTRNESLNAHTCWSLNLGVVCEADESSPHNSACYETLNRDTDFDKFFRWGYGKLASSVNMAINCTCSQMVEISWFTIFESKRTELISSLFVTYFKRSLLEIKNLLNDAIKRSNDIVFSAWPSDNVCWMSDSLRELLKSLQCCSSSECQKTPN
jgi:hypothetical protein